MTQPTETMVTVNQAELDRLRKQDETLTQRKRLITKIGIVSAGVGVAALATVAVVKFRTGDLTVNPAAAEPPFDI